jgi:hypothetical protein
VKAVGGHARAFLPESGVGLRRAVTGDDMEGVRRGQILTEAVKEVEQSDIHLLRFPRQAIPEDMIDPPELVGEIIPRRPIHRFEPFIRMGVEKRKPLGGVRSGKASESRAGGRGDGPGQGGEAPHSEDLAAAHPIAEHCSSVLFSFSKFDGYNNTWKMGKELSFLKQWEYFEKTALMTSLNRDFEAPQKNLRITALIPLEWPAVFTREAGGPAPF